MGLIEDKDSEEEARMINQAELGHMSKRLLLMRCQSMTADSSGGGPPMTRLREVYREPALQKHEDSRVARIHQVIIGGCDRRSCGGTGTIEAHVNGFEYKDPILHECIAIMYDNVKWCFYGLGNEMQPPLMQFYLKRPIKTGNSETKDIQIRVVPLSYNNMEGDRNEDLKNFIHKVQESRRTCESDLDSKPIDFQALDEFQFKAAYLPTGAPTTCAVTRYALVADLPTGAPTTCAVTRYALVVLTKEPPYLLVPLLEIQFVNLACFEDGIEMTVVFADMKRNVLQLHSIPIGYLTGIKHRLNRADVKYYVNSLRPNWSEGVRRHRDLPDVFLADGGWDFLEDSLTLANYPPLDLEEDFDSAYKEAENIWKIVRASKSKRGRIDPETDEIVVD